MCISGWVSEVAGRRGGAKRQEQLTPDDKESAEDSQEPDWAEFYQDERDFNPVRQEREVDVALATAVARVLDGLELVLEDGFRVVEEATDEGRFAVIDGTGVAERYTYKSSNFLIKEDGEWRAIASHVSGRKDLPETG